MIFRKEQSASIKKLSIETVNEKLRSKSRRNVRLIVEACQHQEHFLSNLKTQNSFESMESKTFQRKNPAKVEN